MESYKNLILSNICYTDLVFGRINKKLDSRFSKEEIEEMIFEILKESDATHFQKKGKNIYVSNSERKIRITINFNTCRVITVDAL